MLVKLFWLVSLGVVLSNAARVSYDGYKIYSVMASNSEQKEIIKYLQSEGMTILHDARNNDVAKIVVSPNVEREFLDLTEKNGMKTTVEVSDVESYINMLMAPTGAMSRSSSLGSFDWNQYHNLEAIHAWLDELQELYPDIVTVLEIGFSNEGRPIKGVKIDFKPDSRGEKPVTGVIEGGIHAREWISPATVTWIIKEFLTSTDLQVRAMAEDVVWHIFPVINPDGYDYTFTTDRMWRKNRNLNYSSNCTWVVDDKSNGIDLNRNFDFVWMTIGASQNPCDETFAGPSASSEPETLSMSNYVLRLNNEANLVYYLAFHSYTQLVLIPYSHVSGYDALSVGNYADLYEIAVRGVDKIREKSGEIYLAGTSADILYEVSGSSMDWAKGVVGVPITYLIELRDLGTYGFLLPTEQIIPNNEEIMAYLREMDKYVRELNYYSSSVNVICSVALIFTCLIASFGIY